MEHIRKSEWISGKNYKKNVLADNLGKTLNLIEDVIIDPKGEVPCHSHKFTDEIFFITKNKVIMNVNDISFEVKEGDLIFVDKNESHGFENPSNEIVKLVVLKLNHKNGDSYLG